MGLGFEITTEDIQNVASKMNVSLSEESAEYFLENINDGYVEKKALYGDNIDDQTEYAYEAIKEELLNDEEFLELFNMDEQYAVNFLQEILNEYADDNGKVSFEKISDLKNVLVSYCEDYISTDDHQLALVDQAFFVLFVKDIRESVDEFILSTPVYDLVLLVDTFKQSFKDILDDEL